MLDCLLFLFLFVNSSIQESSIQYTVDQVAENIYSSATNQLRLNPNEALAIKNRILDHGPSIVSFHLDQYKSKKEKPTAYEFAKETLFDLMDASVDEKDSPLPSRYVKRYAFMSGMRLNCNRGKLWKFRSSKSKPSDKVNQDVQEQPQEVDFEFKMEEPEKEVIKRLKHLNRHLKNDKKKHEELLKKEESIEKDSPDFDEYTKEREAVENRIKNRELKIEELTHGAFMHVEKVHQEHIPHPEHIPKSPRLCARSSGCAGTTRKANMPKIGKNAALFGATSAAIIALMGLYTFMNHE